jgi:diaminobutyrate-pyruvate transaminase/4-aminobutyrate aminotransferase/(S)-3-amino-2-methylpropionate transaminase
MFAPVGRGGGCVKISPPLCITADAIDEGIEVLSVIVDKAVANL